MPPGAQPPPRRMTRARAAVAPGSFRPSVLVGDTGIEPVTSSVSGKRAPAAPIARADDGTRTRDPHLGKVMLYQLSHIRVTPLRGAGRKLAEVSLGGKTHPSPCPMRCLTPRRPTSLTGQRPGTCQETLGRDMSFSYCPAFSPQSWQGSPYDHADDTDASGRTGTSGSPPAPDLAGLSLSTRGNLRRLGDELRPLLLGRQRCRFVPVRRRGP